jgi:hypothetical protein
MEREIMQIKQSLKSICVVCLIMFMVACSPQAAPAATSMPQATITPQLTSTPEPTKYPTRTPKPTPTKESVQYVTLGSPFASDCGDGIPRIWSNDSFNSPARDIPSDEHHGHVDIFVPKGCNINKYSGEVLAPISGRLVVGDIPGHPNVYLLYPDTFNINGIQDALSFAGIKKPDLFNISEIRLNLGHFHSIIENVETEAYVNKGQVIGDIVPVGDHFKIAYQIYVIYNGIDYAFSPTLFKQEQKWICVPNSPYDCVAEPHDYIK